MSTEFPEPTALDPDAHPSEFRWELIAAAGGLALWKIVPTGTIIKLVGLIAGDCLAYRALKPRASPPDDGAARVASNAVDGRT
jgi:hypothetical protein